MWNKKRISNWVVVCTFSYILLLTSCGTTKPTTGRDAGDGSLTSTKAAIEFANQNRLRVDKFNAKMSFEMVVDGKNISIGGHLRMKRNDVIQLSLVAMGIIEAGRIEFTQDSVLIVDRINQRYLKESYKEIEFLRSAKIDFYCLQALFWNEIFAPGDGEKLVANKFEMKQDDLYRILQIEGQQKLTYRFLTEMTSGLLAKTHVTLQDESSRGNLHWNYSNFTALKERKFPTQMNISLQAGGKNVAINLGLSRIGAEGDWNTRTSLSTRYTKVSVDEVLKQLMVL